MHVDTLLASDGTTTQQLLDAAWRYPFDVTLPIVDEFLGPRMLNYEQEDL